jgi:hypothetical protein
MIAIRPDSRGYWFVSISTHTIYPHRGQQASDDFVYPWEMNPHAADRDLQAVSVNWVRRAQM